MSLLCKIFGHKPPMYGVGPDRNGTIVPKINSGGTYMSHAKVYGVCPRCGSVYEVCWINADILEVPPTRYEYPTSNEELK